MRLVVSCSAALAVALAVSSAAAQPEDRAYDEEPTTGLETPLTPLAGEFDAMAVVANPAGLRFLRGSHFGLLLHLDDDEHATTGGAGFGAYHAFTSSGRLLPPIGFGVGVEVLRPDRPSLTPDPGEATRLSLGSAMALGDASAFGVTYHRFFDDSTRSLHGVSTWDFGLTSRLGRYAALGVVARDVGRPNVAGAPVQRRYEGELSFRPTGTERLELALGGRLGETRLDVDGWLRWSWRVVRGVYFKGEVVAQSLQQVTVTPEGVAEDEVYEGRVTAGLELSFGRTGVSGFGTLASDIDGDDPRALSTSVYLRLSEEQASPLLGEAERIAQFELSGPMGDRRLTNTVILLKDAREDDAVKGVFVRIDGMAGGWAAASTLRAELGKIQAAGKPVMAYMVAGTTRDYYIASVADTVWVDPAGGLRLAGFAATSLYFKGLFDTLGVLAQFERIEEYKSAPESYTRTGPTEPALRMRNELYDDMYATLIDGIATGRKITPARARELVDDGPYTAGQLEKLTELVDGVVEPDKLGEAVRKAMGGRSIPFRGRPRRRPEYWAHPAMAIIFVDGDIVSGKSQVIPFLGRRLAGAETIVGAIASARANPDIDAIVLRIDSPGGSALASELMAREVFKTRGVKPIICSMGDLAASGGYFIAAGCDVIYAEPTTITGSIGIFTGKVEVSSLLSQLGLSWVTYTRGKFADRESYFRPYTEEEKLRIKEQIRYYYGRFTGTVAKGRGMTEEAVDEVGRGHVWTGKQAKAVKLVDELGGIGDAIARAKAEAGIAADMPTRVIYLPAPAGSLLSRLLGLGFLGALEGEDGAVETDVDQDYGLENEGDGGAAAKAAALLGLPGAGSLLDALPGSLLLDPTEPQARLPFAIVWGK
jgi:protease-4